MAVETISQLFLNTVQSYPKDDMMLFKKGGAYVSLSSREILEQVKNTALGLKSLGVGPGDKIVILSENREFLRRMVQATRDAGMIMPPRFNSIVSRIGL